MTPIFYLEAQIDPSSKIALGDANLELQRLFSDGLIETLRLNLDLCTSDDVYASCLPPYVISIKAVEYTGSVDATVYHNIKDCQIVVNSYKMRDDEDGDILNGDLSSTNPRLLPHSSLEDTWERLIFDRDIKESLVRLATNSLRFTTLNRLILLTGCPGTGKTTLAQALAQRLSITLNADFTSTFLLHLRPAALFSQFFGQSAKQIHMMFASISNLSSANPGNLYILVIDEVESLAGSRSKANAQGEVQDAVRATNELLVGFDTIKNRKNVFVICTSNLLDSLDDAFRDRCCDEIVVPPPGAAAKYDILRNSLEKLVEDGIIRIGEDDALSTYNNAVESRQAENGTTGMHLRSLVDNLCRADNRLVSARWLRQLPELAIGNNLPRSATCGLGEAVDLMIRYVESKKPGQKQDEPANPDTPDNEQSPKRKRCEDDRGTSAKPNCSKRAKLGFLAPLEEMIDQTIKAEVEKQLRSASSRFKEEMRQMMDEMMGQGQQQLPAMMEQGRKIIPDAIDMDMPLPPKADSTDLKDLIDLEDRSTDKENGTRGPLHEIAQGAENMLL